MTDATDIFGHVKDAHKDLARPADHMSTTDRLAWAFDPDVLNPEVDGHKAGPGSQPGQAAAEGIGAEQLESLTVLDQEERFLLSVDNTLAIAYNDVMAADFNQHFARSSIAVKARGRDDALKLQQATNQKISVPTTLQKIRKRFVGGKEQKPEEEEDVDT